MFHEKHPDVAIELNVTRRPYSFNGDNVERRGPRTWQWKDGLCVYMRGQVLPLLSQMCGVTEEDWLSFGSVAGWKSMLKSGDMNIPSVIVRACQRFDPSVTLEILTARMQEAEDNGLTGQKCRGTYVTALDRALGGGAPQFMKKLGESVAGKPIEFNTEVEFEFQPVDSQRMLQWAGRFGKQEEVVSVLANLHFEKQQSATKRSTLIEAVERVGLDKEAFVKFLESDELVDDIWKSYGDTIHQHGIHSIPYFIFNGPFTNGGPFRDGSRNAVDVHGSANSMEFAEAFEKVYMNTRAHIARGASLEGPHMPVAKSIAQGKAKEHEARNKNGYPASPKKGLKKGFLL